MDLIVQYYDKYTKKNKPSLEEQADGRMPPWMYIGMQSAQHYAQKLGVEYRFLRGEELMDFGTPFLSGQTIVWNPAYDEYDNILLLDCDTIVTTEDSPFPLSVPGKVGMVHQWNDIRLTRRAYEAPYKAFVDKAPNSKYFPEHTRNLSGAFQLWSKEARIQARTDWMHPAEWYVSTRKTEQPYINTHLTLHLMAEELPQKWCVQPTVLGTVEDSKILHYGGQARKYGMFDYIEGKPLLPIKGCD